MITPKPVTVLVNRPSRSCHVGVDYVMSRYCVRAPDGHLSGMFPFGPNSIPQGQAEDAAQAHASFLQANQSQPIDFPSLPVGAVWQADNSVGSVFMKLPDNQYVNLSAGRLWPDGDIMNFAPGFLFTTLSCS